MANPAKKLYRKVSSVSAAAAALLSSVNALAGPTNDPDTAQRTRDALDALNRLCRDNVDQVRFHAGGQLDPQTQEILLAGHTSHVSHSSHVSGSYTPGDGSGDSSGSTSAPSYTAPSYNPAPAPAPSYTPMPTPRPAPTVDLAYKSGTRLAGSVIQKGSWGLQLGLRDATRIQIPRSKLRKEDIDMLDLPAPKTADTADVPPMVYLRLNDGTTYTGRVSAADGAQITLTADDNTSQTFQRAQMDPDTFLALQGLGPDTPPSLAPASSVATTGASAVRPVTPAVVGQQILIKLTSGTRMLVTLLAKSDIEIQIRTTDGHEYRLPTSRLSTETLVALGMQAPTSDADPSPAPKHRRT